MWVHQGLVVGVQANLIVQATAVLGRNVEAIQPVTGFAFLAHRLKGVALPGLQVVEPCFISHELIRQ